MLSKVREAMMRNERLGDDSRLVSVGVEAGSLRKPKVAHAPSASLASLPKAQVVSWATLG